MNLRFIDIIRVEQNVRSGQDKRRRVMRVLCEYRGEDGLEYRKWFEKKTKKLSDITIPKSGDNKDITKMRYQ